jgi:DNA polymerase I-like protein with 3'-5' exonuclease and polymerase domains
MQLPLFAPPIEWHPPALADLPSWSGAKRIALDVETRDENLTKTGIGVRRGGYITGISFTIEGHRSYYLPIRHAGGGNLDPQAVLRYVRDNAATFSGQVVGAYLSYDLDYLLQEDIKFPQLQYFRDIQVAEPLIDELQDSFSLAAIGRKYGVEAKNEEFLRKAALEFKIDPKKEMWKLHSGYVGAYAERDSASPLLLLREQEKLIEQQDLWNIWNLESKVLPVLVKMRRRGVLIDQDKLAQVEAYSLVEAQKAMDKIKALTGVEISHLDVMNNNKCAKAFEAIGIKLGFTAKGKINIDQTILERTGELGKTLNWARKVSKLRTTFAQSIRTHMVNGRIHCTFNQIARSDGDGDDTVGAKYGRLSAVDPNLQQQPSRDEFASFWRSIYIPEPGAIFNSNDYKQQEPRWTTHFAALMKLKGAEAAAERYRNDPKTDNHDMMTRFVHSDALVDQWLAEKNPLYKGKRSEAKDIFLGLCYGEGGAKLCRDLGLPTRWAFRPRASGVKFFETRKDALAYKYQSGDDGFMWEAAGEEGQAILDKFDAKVPFVRELAKAAKEKAARKGVVRTVGGRALHFPMRNDGSYDWTHKALNRVIQGSGADQTKIAMVMIDAEMPETFMQLQVHDEINSSVSGVEEATKIAVIMRDCIPNTLVPFQIDIEMGKSWGEVKAI